MKIIGLTGGIASGKSTVSQMIRDMGIPVICADEIAHRVVENGKPAYKKIIKNFGNDILNQDKTLNREKLGSIVFANSKKRKLLNSIVHPEVIKEINMQIKNLKNPYSQPNNRPPKLPAGKRASAIHHPQFVVLDVPLLFEGELYKMCDYTILVYIPEDQMKQRLHTRDGLSDQEIKNRIASQMSIEKKRKKADSIIDNSGSLEDTKKQLCAILNNILNQGGSL